MWQGRKFRWREEDNQGPRLWVTPKLRSHGEEEETANEDEARRKSKVWRSGSLW